MLLDKRTTQFLIVFAFSFFIGGIALAQENVHPAANLPLPQASLTVSERNQAVEVAVPISALSSMLELMDPTNLLRTVVADVRLIRETPDDESREKLGERLVLVTLYRYEDDASIYRLVDLASNRVVREKKAVGVTPPLARVEADLARELALNNFDIRKKLGAQIDEVEVEFLLTSTSDESDPQFGHRVVYLLFKTPQGYLSSIGSVIVDLTDSVVLLDR